MAKTKPSSKKYLYRSDSNRVIAGVCAGVAEYFDIDPIILRVILVVITIFGGSGILIYIILWIVMPTESRAGENSDENIRENVEEIKSKAKKIAGKDRNVLLGVIFLVIGFSFLLSNFGVVQPLVFSKLWPLIIIALGVSLLFKNERR